MEMLAPKLEPSPAAGSGSMQRMAYGLLAVLLLSGAWIRFNDRLAELSPGLASPVAQRIAERAALAGQPASLAELALLAPGADAAATAGLGLPRDQAAAMAADLRRDRIRLVQVPLFDAGAVGTGPRMVSVSSGGYGRLVALTRTPTMVMLPIDRVGTISFRTAGAGSPDPVGIGMLTLAGPLQLPDLAAGQRLDVGVIAQ